MAVPSSVGGMVRPVTGADMGIRRAEIHPGLREVIICKDQERKVGLRLRDIDNVSKALCIKHFLSVMISVVFHCFECVIGMWVIGNMF